ncbi:hypothetical protein NUW54_g14558 [Trametes sanguinea]|uniref:Uncharacterized protein n=1 Tax=Trametes sanguinea TaxID=158606 RepID=A0ACC1MBZ6_9APHY|nr:hypothetical protein NUW54_g14558 [Trametes sanguinea]
MIPISNATRDPVPDASARLFNFGPSRHPSTSLLRLLPSVPALFRLLPTITTLVTTVASSTLLIVPFVPGHSAVVCQRDPEPDGSCRRDLLRVPGAAQASGTNMLRKIWQYRRNTPAFRIHVG